MINQISNEQQNMAHFPPQSTEPGQIFDSALLSTYVDLPHGVCYAVPSKKSASYCAGLTRLNGLV